LIVSTRAGLIRVLAVRPRMETARAVLAAHPFSGQQTIFLPAEQQPE
jgi:hypothetical protein